MKKNKGYTLVELLVSMVVLMMVLTEVYVVMSNGSSVYNKGSYDVSLQTKAQQALMHLEDILIDANESVAYTDAGATGDNGKLLVVNDPGDDYLITYDNSDPVGQLYGYGKLMLTVTHDDGTVEPAVPLCDNVATYNVITGEIDGKTGDSVFVNLALSNKEYNFSTQTKEIYLRNKLGTRGTTSVDDDSSPSANFTLNVLRHKTYNLGGNKYYFTVNTVNALGDTISTKKFCNYFEWQSADGLDSLDQMNDPGNKYEMTGNTTVKCNAGLNKKAGWDQAATAVIRGYVDAAARAATPNEFVTITVTTDKVGVGTTEYDESAGYINLNHATSDPASSMTKVYGISVEDADKVDYILYSCPDGQHIKADSSPSGRVVIKKDSGGGDEIRFEGVTKNTSYDSEVISLSKSAITSTDIFFCQDITEGATLKIKPQNDPSEDYANIKNSLYVYLDGNTNSFSSYGKNQQTDNRIGSSFAPANEMFYLECKIYYPGGTDQYLQFPCFFLFTGDYEDNGYSLNKVLCKWAYLDDK